MMLGHARQPKLVEGVRYGWGEQYIRARWLENIQDLVLGVLHIFSWEVEGPPPCSGVDPGIDLGHPGVKASSKDEEAPIGISGADSGGGMAVSWASS